MVKLTQSLSIWLWENYPHDLPLIKLGHTELITDEMWSRYIEWCCTDEGRRYLEGGDLYDGNCV